MDERARSWEERFEWPMVIAALLVIPVLVIEESNFGGPWETVGQVLNWGTWLAFLVEAVVMVAVTPKPTEWLKRHPLDVAVVILSPPFLPNSLAAARLFRLLRVLRLLRLFTLRRLWSLEGIRYAAFLTAFLVLVGGAAYSAVEEGRALSAWDGIWWSINTVTTVGYAGSPETDAGRTIAIVVMTAGIAFVALLTAFIADRFIEQDVEGVEEQGENLLVELRAISERLERVEQQLGTRPPS